MSVDVKRMRLLVTISSTGEWEDDDPSPDDATDELIDSVPALLDRLEAAERVIEAARACGRWRVEEAIAEYDRSQDGE